MNFKATSNRNIKLTQLVTVELRFESRFACVAGTHFSYIL